MAACGKRELSLSKAVGTFHPVGMGWIVFFDGDCAFCSGTVRWLVLFDWRCNLRFSPLQGELARAKGLEALADPAGGTMVVLRESDGATFTYSDAWLEVTRALGARQCQSTLPSFTLSTLRRIGALANCQLPATLKLRECHASESPVSVGLAAE